MTAYTSTHTHSSIEKDIKVAGVGSRNLRTIDVDANFAMRSELLEEAIELKSLAHWLKGAGGTAGFQPLTESAFELEMALAAEDSVAVARTLSELDGLEKQILGGLCCV